jgi:hypothetical protein
VGERSPPSSTSPTHRKARLFLCAHCLKLAPCEKPATVGNMPTEQRHTESSKSRSSAKKPVRRAPFLLRSQLSPRKPHGGATVG